MAKYLIGARFAINSEGEVYHVVLKRLLVAEKHNGEFDKLTC
jgi:hypothetical protein